MNHRLFFALFYCSLAILVPATADQPNVVIILADDLGYGDVHAYNRASTIATSNFDRLAKEGMLFTDAHTPSAVCTPTRYGLLTGRYCWRSPLKRGVLNGYGEPLIEADRPTVASFMSEHGYLTGIVGKWHLGLSFAKTSNDEFDFTQPVGDAPHTRGFKSSFIIPASLDFPPYVYIKNDRITDNALVTQEAQKFPSFLRAGERSPALVMENCLDDLLAESVKFIETSVDLELPFFLYMPLTAPHKPTLPHPRFRGQSGLGPYGDFVAQVDWTVGQVIDTIDDSGVADNTLIIVTSDNGSYMYRRDGKPDHVDDETVQAYRSEHHKANGELRGTKADIWEAGHRVPFIVRWPGNVRPGSRTSTPICLTDIFATLSDLLEEDMPEGAAEDSHSFLALLRGRPMQPPRPPIVHHSVAGMFAIRDGDWKLVLGNGSGGRERPKGEAFKKPYQLFELTMDPAESMNVVDAYPDIANALEAKLLALKDR